jgi:N-acetylglucosamine-6-phosphate deacetylase
MITRAGDAETEQLGEGTYLIRGAVVTPAAVLAAGWVFVRGDVIAGVGDAPPPGSDVIVDVGKRTIVPGFVDVHVHGGAGGQAAGSDPDAVSASVATLARFHAGHGTTCLLATTMSDTPERILATVIGIRRAMDGADPSGAMVAGIHLEGPWMASARRDAPDPDLLRRRPDPAELDALIEASGGAVRLITIAPELEGADAVIAAALKPALAPGRTRQQLAGGAGCWL